MNTPQRFGEILATIKSAYGSLEEPNYAFAEKRYRALRCHTLVGELMRRYFVRDETDLNGHVSMHLRVLHAEGSVVVCLSFVDNWAMLFRLASEVPVYEEVILPDSSTATNSEREIALLLQNHGCKLLTKDEAAQKVAMNLCDTDRDEALVYHAIVSDDGLVPKVLFQ